MRHIVIIGAGLGGLAAALRLSSRGHRITLFERNEKPGGKMHEFQTPEFRFDTGPSLLTLPDVLNELFDSAGEKMENYLDLVEPDPLCRYFYPDGTVFDSYRETKKTLEQIGTFAPEDRIAYTRFLEYSEDLYQKTSGAFLQNPLYSLGDLFSLKLTDVFRIDAFQTVSGKIDEMFTSGYMRKFFKRFTTYNGSSPFKAPATLNVIPHVEITMGGFYVKGGMYRIAETLESLLVKRGVKIYYNHTVKRIEVQKKRVAGVILENGDSVECDLILSNSDASETILNLISKKHLRKPVIRMQKNLEPSCSGFVLMLGTGKKWKQLGHHNIFFSGDYQKEFTEIFEQRKLPEDPTIYVANTSVTDPDHAPEGGSNLFILVNAPYVADGQNWKKTVREYPKQIINKLEAAGIEGLAEAVQLQKTITPKEFQSRYRSNRGSIYGTSSNSRMAAFMRPGNKLRSIGGLYMAGGSTHPGGGIPLVLLSARHAVTLMERYERV